MAKIYAPGKNFACYRLCHTVAGKRRMQTFPQYSDARQAGERIVREIAQGSQAAGLSAGQAQDALAAIERLAALRQSIGHQYSLLGAVSEFADAATLVRGRSSCVTKRAVSCWQCRGSAVISPPSSAP